MKLDDSKYHQCVVMEPGVIHGGFRQPSSSTWEKFDSFINLLKDEWCLYRSRDLGKSMAHTTGETFWASIQVAVWLLYLFSGGSCEQKKELEVDKTLGYLVSVSGMYMLGLLGLGDIDWN